MTNNPKHQGLNTAQVIQSRQKHGVNVITPPPRPSLWRKYLGYFRDPLIRILLVALCLSIGIAVYEYVVTEQGSKVFLEPLGIFLAIQLATLIGFWLEVSADRKFEILNAVNDDMPVKVLRDARVCEIPRRDVVVDDVVILDTGDEVPADGTLFDSLSLSVDESSLTGEPIAHKSHIEGEISAADTTYPPTAVMRGTTVVEGRGRMLVSAVGDATEQGHVFKASTIDTGNRTPLDRQFDRLGRLISYASYGVGLLIVIGRCVMMDWGAATTIDAIEYALTTVMLAITLIVVSVPEGLPMSITLSLALSMRRMLATNNLVRRMHACETMGATTVICTDKTGTLTRNRISVAATNFYCDKSDTPSTQTALAIALNSTAFLDGHKVVGNPTEGALLLWLADAGIDYAALRDANPIIEQLPFSTRRKFMATAIAQADGSRLVFLKGAPEILLNLCASVANNQPRKDISAQLLEYQNHAYRTLGFAVAHIPASDAAPLFIDDELRGGIDFEFTGICAISDPVRDEVPAAIADSLAAGIAVKIVTGDTPGTAREIGRQVGLWTDSDGDDAHISGPEWAALSDEEAARRASRIKIMSRARPTDKSRLVSVLQQQGEVVAVTGDGTNDAPALNAAQVGLAMGDGTSVAKQAGDIIIMDNSFASIAKAVMWGRSLYLNIQRFVLFQLTVNLVACIIVVIGAFTGTQSPLSVTQMLWVNLIMDTFAALALASLPPSSAVMKQKPRRDSDFIITPAMTRRIVGLSVLFVAVLWFFLQYLRFNTDNAIDGVDWPAFFASFFSKDAPALTTYDLTLFFTTFVFLQVWNLFNARSFASGHSPFHNWRQSKVFFGVISAIFIGQFAIVYLGGQMFNVEPIPLSDMLTIMAITAPIMLIPLLSNLLKTK